MTEKDQVQIFEAKLMEAMKRGDTAVLDLLLDERLVFNIPSGETITKEMDLENYRSGRIKVFHIEVEDQKISLFDNISIVSVVIHLNATYSGHSIDGKFRYLRVWKKSRDFTWKVIGGSGISLQ